MWCSMLWSSFAGYGALSTNWQKLWHQSIYKLQIWDDVLGSSRCHLLHKAGSSCSLIFASQGWSSKFSPLSHSVRSSYPIYRKILISPEVLDKHFQCWNWIPVRFDNFKRYWVLEIKAYNFVNPLYLLFLKRTEIQVHHFCQVLKVIMAA